MADFGLPIPKNTENILFAEDLVSYIMLGFDRSYRYPSTAELYRRHVYNACTDEVRYAVVFLCKKFNRSNFLKYDVLKGSRYAEDISDYYNVVADDLFNWCFLKGFSARKFLFFCAQVSSMAGVFYVFGTMEAPKMAVSQIETTLECFRMQAGAWDTVYAIAKEISKLNYFRDCQFDVEDLVQEFKKCDSPKCLTPPPPQPVPDDDDDGDLRNLLPLIVDLREFTGFDEEWRDQLIKKYTADIVTFSDDSSSDSSEEANEV